MNDSGDLTRAELYDRLKGQMQYEDELIDKIRVVWQLLAQSFFFSTYATLLNAKGEGKDELFVQQQEFLLWVVPIVALTAGLIASISILPPSTQLRILGTFIRDIRINGEAMTTPQDYFLPSKARRPFVGGARVAPIGLPLLFILTWLVILMRLIAAEL
jgi:hypothetical protein